MPLFYPGRKIYLRSKNVADKNNHQEQIGRVLISWSPGCDPYSERQVLVYFPETKIVNRGFRIVGSDIIRKQDGIFGDLVFGELLIND